MHEIFNFPTNARMNDEILSMCPPSKPPSPALGIQFVALPCLGNCEKSLTNCIRRGGGGGGCLPAIFLTDFLPFVPALAPWPLGSNLYYIQYTFYIQHSIQIHFDSIWASPQTQKDISNAFYCPHG